MAGASKRKASTDFGKSYKKARKTYRRSRIAGNVGQQMRMARQIRTWKENWAFNTATTAGFRKYFAPTLAEVSDQAQYVALFDEYRIKRIDVTFAPRWTQIDLSANSASTLPSTNNQFYLTVGYDRTVEALAGTYSAGVYNGTWQQCENTRMFVLDKPVTYSFVPRVLDSGSSGTRYLKSPWLATAVTDNQHVGIQAFLHDANFSAVNANGFSVDVYYNFHIEFRGER